jgi:hypothetical protein
MNFIIKIITIIIIDYAFFLFWLQGFVVQFPTSEETNLIIFSALCLVSLS